MMPVKVCSICGGAIVGFGNDAWPVRPLLRPMQCGARHSGVAIAGARQAPRQQRRGLQMIGLNDIEDDSILVIHAV